MKEKKLDQTLERRQSELIIKSLETEADDFNIAIKNLDSIDEVSINELNQ